jgi:hypothetical protein
VILPCEVRKQTFRLKKQIFTPKIL